MSVNPVPMSTIMEDDLLTSFKKRKHSFINGRRSKKLSIGESDLCTSRMDSSQTISKKKSSLPATLNSLLVKNACSIEPKENDLFKNSNTTFIKTQSESQPKKHGSIAAATLEEDGIDENTSSDSVVMCGHSVINLTSHVSVAHTSSTDSDKSNSCSWQIASPKVIRRSSTDTSSPSPSIPTVGSSPPDSAFIQDNDEGEFFRRFEPDNKKFFAYDRDRTPSPSPPSSPTSSISSSSFANRNGDLSPNYETVLTLPYVSDVVSDFPPPAMVTILNQRAQFDDSDLHSDSDLVIGSSDDSPATKPNNSNNDCSSGIKSDDEDSPVVSVVSLLSVLTGLEDSVSTENNTQLSSTAAAKQKKVRSISCSSVPTRRDSMYNNVMNLPVGPANLRKSFKKSNSYTNTIPSKRLSKIYYAMLLWFKIDFIEKKILD